MYDRLQHVAGTGAARAAYELLPVIRRLRHDTEGERRIAGPIVDGLRNTRLCRMAITRELHGLELPIADALEVYELLAGAEASVAWIVWNNSLPAMFSRYLDGAARGELFGNPQWLYASSTRPSGRAITEGDGYRVNGRWSLVSGCQLAEWIALMCIVEEPGERFAVQDDAPEMRLLFVRRGNYEIVDTWDAGGLRGTGSHDVVVKEGYVPRRWSVSPEDPNTLAAPIARIPIICSLALGFAAQALGIAGQALDTIVELARTKAGVDPGPRLGDRPAVQASIARHAAAVAAARTYLHSCADMLWDSATAEAAPAMARIGAAWAAAHHAVDAARRTVDAMYRHGGTSSLYIDCPLERAHRDMHAMLGHIICQTFWLEDAGRAELGISPRHPLYAV